MTLSDIMNDALKHVALWYNKEDLLVNPSNTEGTYIVLNMSFFGIKLGCFTGIKLLGVIFYHHLNWGKHIK